MVPTVFIPFSESGCLFGTESLIAFITFQDTTPTLERTYPGVVSIVKQSYVAQSLPESAIKIIISSLADSTLKQYNVVIRKWWLFCIEKNINIFDKSIPSILEFLVKEYHLGANFSTLNSCRSALALILGKSISEDDRIIRFMKGVYRTKPSFPRYKNTWDPNLVLDHLSKLYPNENLTLASLSKKLVALLALSTAQRVQTLSLIRLSGVEVSSAKIVIYINDLIKTSAPNRLAPKLIIPFFCNREQVCPAKTLSAYIEATKVYRSLPLTERLILTTKKPIHNASTATISRWIRDVLTESGIDTAVFTAHSTRHASTSAARRKGVSVDIIKKTAGWSGESLTFAKFYNRPITVDEDNAFAEAIYNR